MSEKPYRAVEEFLTRMRAGLRLTGPHSGEIAAEMRADIYDHIASLRSEGLTEDDAVARALEEMGNPYEVAHHVRGVVALWSHPAVEVCRYVVASGIILWAIYVTWCRAWGYGFDTAAYIAGIGFHLPMILIIWPRIVWRKNWLFGIAPAAICGVAVLAVATLGTQAGMADAARYAALTCIVAFAIYVITLMQQPAQRRFVLLAVLAAFCAVEVPYQLEEMVYRQHRATTESYLNGYHDAHGSYPTRDEFNEQRNESLASTRMTYLPSDDGKGFSLFWTRPLNSGFAICFSSDGRLWIND